MLPNTRRGRVNACRPRRSGKRRPAGDSCCLVSRTRIRFLGGDSHGATYPIRSNALRVKGASGGQLQLVSTPRQETAPTALRIWLARSGSGQQTGMTPITTELGLTKTRPGRRKAQNESCGEVPLTIWDRPPRSKSASWRGVGIPLAAMDAAPGAQLSSPNASMTTTAFAVHGQTVEGRRPRAAR